MLIRGALLIFLGICAALSWSQLTRFATWHAYAGLADDVLYGRAVPEDLQRFAPLLNQPPTESCTTLRSGVPITLHLYANDVIAAEVGVGPLQFSDDDRLTAHRHATRTLLANALDCTPTDGNLWLSKALVALALGEDQETIVAYIAMSERYAPHEGWISDRRAQLY